MAMALWASAWMASGCGKDEIRVYQSPKDTPVVAASDRGAAAAGDGAAGPSGGGTGTAAEPADRAPVPWTVPAGWEEKPASGMRVASYAVKRPDGRSADISVVALGGGSGGELENVNRWRDQIGLEPVTEAGLAGLRTLVAAGDRQVVMYELDGKKLVLDGKHAARTLAAILPAGEMTVFFKITGENALVAEQKPQFLAWLKSVDTGGGREASAGSPADASSAAASPSAPAAAGRESLPSWQLPADWVSAGSKPMRLASFDIPDASGNGDVSISKLNGDGGGLLANVNRWRGQVGLAPLDAAALAGNSKTVTTAGGDRATWVELVGNEKTILGAIVVRDGASWFFKLTAPSAVAGRQSKSFEQFVLSLRF